MPYDGYLDTNDGWSAFGWAADSARPNEPVEVEFESTAGVLGSTKADVFRADLLAHGLGTGRHGFAFRLPLAMKAGDALTARIKGSNFLLKGSPMPRQPREVVGLVAGDIVNNCNLRCPFCIVDYANVRGLKLMTSETFARALELLPITAPGNFWLSCLHEPTMHPQFIDFIETVPDAYRDRVSFTTNLSKRLPEEMLERLANSGIHSIRVSFDSRRPEVFAELRKNAKYELFEQNLTRLAACMKQSRRRPLLHFITMAFKDNFRDIADLVRYGRELGGNIHEIRYIYYVPHVAHWGKDHILNHAEWAELERSLAPLASPTLMVCGPVQGTQEQFEEQRGLTEYVARENSFGGSEDPGTMAVPEPAAIGRILPDEALRLRLRWDGVVMTEQVSEDVFRVNINKLAQPAEYFEAIRLAAKARELVGAWNRRVTDLLQVLRQELAQCAPAAIGVEIGAHVIPVAGVDPFYLDRVVSFAGSDGRIDIQAEGLTLPIPTGELDYICSSHVLEHLVNPLIGLLEWHRVLKPGGLLYLVVPDKRYTFDEPRALTAVEHLVADFRGATHAADREHVRQFIYETDWSRLQPGVTATEKPQHQQVLFDAYLAQIEQGMPIDIHYHTFTAASLLSLLRASGMIGGIGASFELLGSAERYPPERGDGCGVLLRKRGARKSPASRETFTFSRPAAPARGLRLVCPATLAPLRLRAGDVRDGELAVAGESHAYAIAKGMPILMPPAGVEVRRSWQSPLWRKLWLWRAKLAGARR